jgi:hypothetical protein
MSPEGKAALETLQIKYGIQKGGKNYAKDVLTLSRIGATYPAVCRIIANLPTYEVKYGAFWVS